MSIVTAWQEAVELTCDIRLSSSSNLVQLQACIGTKQSNLKTTTVANWNEHKPSNAVICRVTLWGDHLDAHSFQPPFKSSFEDSKGQRWLGDKAGLLQEDSPRLQRHGIQEGRHLLLGSPHTIPGRRMLVILQPATRSSSRLMYRQ